MDIGILLRGECSSLKIEDTFHLAKEVFENSGILALKEGKMKGTLTYLNDDNLLLELQVNGIMILEDSISLEPVDYPFSFQIEENVIEKVKKGENTLDILSILWENIVLEVPIRFSRVKNYDLYKGDGWHLVSEEDYKRPEGENPFQALLEKMEEE